VNQRRLCGAECFDNFDNYVGQCHLLKDHLGSGHEPRTPTPDELAELADFHRRQNEHTRLEFRSRKKAYQKRARERGWHQGEGEQQFLKDVRTTADIADNLFHARLATMYASLAVMEYLRRQAPR